jgi:hypothetical protein
LKGGANYKLRARFRIVEVSAADAAKLKVLPSGEIYLLGPYEKEPATSRTKPPKPSPHTRR